MKLYFLGLRDGFFALGDENGTIYSVPQDGLRDVDILEPVRWHSFTVKVPDKFETHEDGTVQLLTRSVHIPRHVDDANHIDSACVFDPENKVWYVYDGVIHDPVSPEGEHTFRPGAGAWEIGGPTDKDRGVG